MVLRIAACTATILPARTSPPSCWRLRARVYSGEPVHDARGVRMFKTAPEHGSGRRAFISWSLSSSPR